jgi:hypothetical protein
VTPLVDAMARHGADQFEFKVIGTAATFQFKTGA